MPNILIPKAIILDTSLGSKRAIHYAAVCLSENKAGHTLISNEYMTYLCGYTINRHPGRVYSKFKELTSNLVSQEYLTFVNGSDPAVDKITAVLTTKAQYPKHFALVSDDEFSRIVDYAVILERNRNNRLTQAEIFLLLATLRLWIGTCQEVKHCCCSYYTTISIQSGLQMSTIKSGLEILENLEIIHTELLPDRRRNEDSYTTNKHIFINMKDSKEIGYDWTAELERAKTYYHYHSTTQE